MPETQLHRCSNPTGAFRCISGRTPATRWASQGIATRGGCSVSKLGSSSCCLSGSSDEISLAATLDSRRRSWGFMYQNNYANACNVAERCVCMSRSSLAHGSSSEWLQIVELPDRCFYPRIEMLTFSGSVVLFPLPSRNFETPRTLLLIALELCLPSTCPHTQDI